MAVGQGLAADRHDLTAGGFEDALARRRIPFAGGSEARIDVGSAFGDQAELKRRSCFQPLGDGEVLGAEPDIEIAVDRMAAAGAGREALRWR